MSSIHSLRSIIPRFLGSGGLATGVHWLTMWGLVQLGLEVTIATTVGALSGAVVNYFLQYYVTFRCDESHRRVIPIYTKTCLLGWAVNAVVFYILFYYVGISTAIAQFITTGLVTLLNFSLYHKVVFREQSDT